MFVLLALGQVVLPAHVVLVNHAAVGVQVKDAVDDELHEVHVVADDQQAAREVLEEVSQPHDRVGVQVVGRLVQQHGVSVREEDARQLHAATLTARKGRKRLGEHALGQVQVGGDDRGLGLGGVPTAGDKLCLETVVAAQALGAHRLVLAGHVFLGLTHLAGHAVQAASREDAVTGQLAHVVHLGVLRQVANLAAAGDGAVRGQGESGQYLGHGGLAGAIAAHQADLIALVDAEGNVFHQQARAGAQFKVLYGNHGCLSGGTVCVVLVLRADSQEENHRASTPSILVQGCRACMWFAFISVVTSVGYLSNTVQW